MQNAGMNPSQFGLEHYGIKNIQTAYWNLGAPVLIEHALSRHEGVLAEGGALVVCTTPFTGRSPKDKFIVREPGTEATVDWGTVNQPMTEEDFDRIYTKMLAYVQGRDLYVQDCFVGNDPHYRLPIRVVSEMAWHNLFARQLFLRPEPAETGHHQPEFAVFDFPGFHVDPAHDHTKSDTCIAINFKRKMVIIAGTHYAGEMKKSVFSILNYLLPGRNVLSMHCSANIGPDGHVALFFGLSGTGKTTLSADPRRRLIGDDEHAWNESGVFNIEGGCYAKCIKLSREKEPQIWNAIRYGAVLENVVVDPASRRLDYDSAEITENTRAAYPVEFIDNAVIPSLGGHPNHVIFLTADAFGVLPPISKLTHEQARYHFLSGYTSKVSGTERGLGNEPEATFSACFAGPFLPRPAEVYSKMLGAKLREHHAACWLINTGWVGGPFGIGKRIDLPYTRAMVTAALEGKLRDVPFEKHPVFGVLVPKACPGVPPEALDARGMWRDKEAYNRAARALAAKFHQNFKRFPAADAEVAEAAPAA